MVWPVRDVDAASGVAVWSLTVATIVPASDRVMTDSSVTVFPVPPTAPDQVTVELSLKYAVALVVQLEPPVASRNVAVEVTVYWVLFSETVLRLDGARSAAQSDIDFMRSSSCWATTSACEWLRV